jgi:sugar/nucleoside kinase (ribokinase family)
MSMITVDSYPIAVVLCIVTMLQLETPATTASIARKLRSLGPPIVIVKLGSRGCLLAEGSALSVTRFGAQPGAPSRADLEGFPEGVSE